MRKIVRLVAAALIAVGCAHHERIARVHDVADLPPGFAVVVATFETVPDQSAFGEAQVIEDAYYVAGRLSVMGYQSFVVHDSQRRVRVGVRASTHALARSLEREIEAAGVIDLGDGNILPVPEPELINMAELQLRTAP